MDSVTFFQVVANSLLARKCFFLNPAQVAKLARKQFVSAGLGGGSSFNRFIMQLLQVRLSFSILLTLSLSYMFRAIDPFFILVLPPRSNLSYT